jgi:RNA polymerase-binding transcription factor DksA
MATDTNHFKEKLREELSTLQKELESVGMRNPDNKEDWEGKPSDREAQPGDDMEVADNIDEFEENTALVKRLEIRFNEVKDAITRIDNGTYGTCEIGGEEIEEARLEANPAARTCIKHKEETPA